MNVSYSDLVTEIYDMAQPIGHSVGDVEYYAAQLTNTDGPILEAACGTGRVLIPLAQAGHEMEGSDYSAAMIEACRRNCERHGVSAQLYAESVRDAAYAAIIVPRGSIRNVEGREATLSALRCFHKSLAAQGVLLLDLSPPNIGTDLGPMDYWESGAYLWTRQDVRVDYDPVVNCTTKFSRYEKWHNGQLVAAELRRFTLQHWGVREFQDLLMEAGFVDIEVTADYGQADSPRADSRRWVFRANRP